MIGKQVKGTSFRGVLNYLHGKDGAQLLGGNVLGETPRAIAAEFRASRRQNLRVKKAVYHAALSLPKTENLGDSQWLAIAQDYLQGMGFEGCQYVVYRHTDQDHDHVHIVASRIRLTDGKTVSDSWDYRRSEQVIRKLERDYQLEPVVPSWEREKRASTTGECRFSERTGTASVREQLQGMLDEVTQNQPTMVEAIAQLQQRGVNVKVWYTRAGQARGISYELDGVAFSGTKLGRAYTFPGLQKHRGVSYELERDDPIIQSLMNEGSERSPLEAPQPTPKDISSPETERTVAPDKKTHYQRLWQRYSQGVQASNPIEFDDLVARRAFEDGQSQKAIALTLAAGSPYVAQLNRQQAKLYVEQTAQKVCERSRHQAKDQRRRRSLEVD
ncbi:MAG: relaxase/mobilization nuclease domain-containing protein [Leptolyngbyaceae bacterium]|nr:relaxase/mobilization nuclease domain-containing protein [Leptolyngbyaceae bacterium]